MLATAVTHLGLMQTQQTAEATHLAAAVLELERRLRSCALAAQWRRPERSTDGTMQVSAAAPAPPRSHERQPAAGENSNPDKALSGTLIRP